MIFNVNMEEEYIVIGYDQEVYKRTYRYEDEIIDSLEEGFVSAILRLKDGKLEYANKSVVTTCSMKKKEYLDE